MPARLALAAALALSLAPIAARAASADDIWQEKCSMCHGDTGHADTKLGKKHKIPDLSSPKAKKLSDTQIHDIISNGVKDTKMKPWKGKLTDAEIASLVKYVRGLQAK